jgi:pyroglutamyl-peptidase
VVGLASACAGEDGTATVARDLEPDGLFAEFMEGKYDSAGHPFGAEVWQAEDRCSGAGEADGVILESCTLASGHLGRGRYAISLRALARTACDDCDDVVAVEVTTESGRRLAQQSFSSTRLAEPMVYTNLATSFSMDSPGNVVVTITGHHSVRLDYVELFTQRDALVVSPPSGVLENDEIVLELISSRPGQPELHCGDVDLTEVLEAELAAGTAARTQTEFRTIVTFPAALVRERCALPGRLRATMRLGSGRAVTSRVTYYDEPPPCTFATGQPRVLLTGFEPFPADSTSDNSSEVAVREAEHGGVDLMKLILPVEWESAAAIVADVRERCQPELVVGFGQGRSAVDVETTAYNLMDSSMVFGGVPDNRGVVRAGDLIVDGGPDEVSTGLPAQEILERLDDADIDANESDDPGRYICNNLFYSIMTGSDSPQRMGGFVHLPRIPRVDDDDRRMLQRVVNEVIDAALQ